MPKLDTAIRYRWSELATDHPMELLERRRIIGEKMMMSEVVLQQGCTVPTHTHVNEQFAWVVSGKMRFGIGEEGSSDRQDIVLQAGEVLHLPSNVPHSAEALEKSVVMDIFSPPSEKTGIDRE